METEKTLAEEVSDYFLEKGYKELPSHGNYRKFTTKTPDNFFYVNEKGGVRHGRIISSSLCISQAIYCGMKKKEKSKMKTEKRLKTTDLEPWQMTKKEWESARHAAGKAELRELKRPRMGALTPRPDLSPTRERIRLEYGAEPKPIRRRGVPIVSYETVIEKALAEGKPVPAHVLAEQKPYILR